MTNTLGSRIRAFRRQAGRSMTQAAFGGLCGVTGTYISQIERDEVEPGADARARIERVLASGPQEAAALAPSEPVEALTPIRRLQDRVLGAHEAYRAILSSPDGSKFFTIAANEVRGFKAPGVAEQVRQYLATHPRSSWTIVHPAPEVWGPASAELIPSLRAGAMVAGSVASMLRDTLGGRPAASAPAANGPAESSRERVRSHAVARADMLQMFDPIIHRVVVVPPREPGAVSPTHYPIGWLEITFEHSNGLPLLIRLSWTETSDVLAWLRAAGVDTAPAQMIA